MINSVGAPQSLLLLGGTSDIAMAVARRYAGRAGLRVVLAARPTERPDQEQLRGIDVDVCAARRALVGDRGVMPFRLGQLASRTSARQNRVHRAASIVDAQPYSACLVR